jgi:phage gp16-like protein
MIMTKEKLSVIHIAKKQLGLEEEEYRKIIRDLGGVESSKELTEAGFEAVMFRFYQLGFQSTWNKKNLGYRPRMASPRQIAMIRELWGQFTEGQGDDASLGKWLEGKFKVSSIRFLDSATAHKACGALKRMTDKPGKSRKSRKVAA